MGPGLWLGRSEPTPARMNFLLGHFPVAHKPKTIFPKRQSIAEPQRANNISRTDGISVTCFAANGPRIGACPILLISKEIVAPEDLGRCCHKPRREDGK